LRDFVSALPFQTRLTQTKPILPLSNEHGSQVKDQGRRQCCHNKHKYFPIGLHVMYLYFPDTPRTKKNTSLFDTLLCSPQLFYLSIPICDTDHCSFPPSYIISSGQNVTIQKRLSVYCTRISFIGANRPNKESV
jgi:hypothetical protein